PLLVEIQALVAPTSLGTPRRAVNGWDQNRLSMVLAVLEAHCGVRLSGHDVYLNVAGGLRIQEPAADLAAAAALVSSFADAPLPADAVYLGEISRSGAVRPVAQAATRLKEAQKLGFARAVLPEGARAEETSEPGLSLKPVSSLASLVADIAAARTDGARPQGKRSGGQQDGGRRGLIRLYTGRTADTAWDLHSRLPGGPITAGILTSWGDPSTGLAGRAGGAEVGTNSLADSTAAPRTCGASELCHAHHSPRHHPDRRHAGFGAARHDPRLHARDPVDRRLGDRGGGDALFLCQAAAIREVLLRQRYHRGGGGGGRHVFDHVADRVRHHRAVFGHGAGPPYRRARPHPWLSLRACTRALHRRHRLPVLRLAGTRPQPARLGSQRQVAGRAAGNGRLADVDVAGRPGKHHLEAVEEAEAGRG